MVTDHLTEINMILTKQISEGGSFQWTGTVQEVDLSENLSSVALAKQELYTKTNELTNVPVL